jgi:hypothetical protein
MSGCQDLQSTVQFAKVLNGLEEIVIDQFEAELSDNLVVIHFQVLAEYGLVNQPGAEQFVVLPT